MTEEEIFEAVRSALAELLVRDGVSAGDIGMDTSLADDLHLDSFLFVDLTVQIEERLGISEFPIRKWADEEMAREGPRFSVRSLVRRCVELVPRSVSGPR
jgi:acyl carrier protein